MGRIVHLEITAANLPQAEAFYRDAFGWQLSAAPMPPEYLLADSGPGDGIDGAVMTRRYQRQPAVPWIAVDDIEATRVAVEKAGGSAADVPKDLPRVGLVCYVEDPEGTVIGLRQSAG